MTMYKHLAGWNTSYNYVYQGVSARQTFRYNFLYIFCIHVYVSMAIKSYLLTQLPTPLIFHPSLQPSLFHLTWAAIKTEIPLLNQPINTILYCPLPSPPLPLLPSISKTTNLFQLSISPFHQPHFPLTWAATMLRWRCVPRSDDMLNRLPFDEREFWSLHTSLLWL